MTRAPHRRTRPLLWRAIVTGGSTPLAEAIAVGLARFGVRVVVSGPVAERLDAVVVAVARIGGQALAVPGPIETLEQAGTTVASAIQAFGRLDLVIWITPFWNGGFIHEHSVAVWDRVLASNLREPFLLLRAALPHMRRQGAGQIVAVGSDSSLAAYARDGAYGVALHGLTVLMDVVRVENADHGIRVHVLAPGLAQTQPRDADGRPNLTHQDVADWVLPPQTPRRSASLSPSS